MNHLRRFGLAISLAVMLAGTAIAGETNTPPCAPGETNTPLCSTSEIITEEASETSSTVSGEAETIIFESASYAVESLLTLF